MNKRVLLVIEMSILIFIESMLYFLLRKITYPIAPLEFKDNSNPAFTKLVIEYFIVRIIFTIPFMLSLARKPNGVSSGSSLIRINALVFFIILICSIVFYPFLFLQSFNVKITGLWYSKISHLAFAMALSPFIFIMGKKLWSQCSLPCF
jgi:hypothetical protein